MIVEPMEISDVRLIRQVRHSDVRGWFSETWRRDVLLEAGISGNFVQENDALSIEPGTIRGLHFQEPPAAQAKLIRVVAGTIFDVAVDIRRGSPTYGKWVSAILTAVSGEQLYVPRGFAHGYCTLEPNTRVAYVVDSLYAPGRENGLSFDDPTLRIDWPVARDKAILSDADRARGRLDDLVTSFTYTQLTSRPENTWD